MDCQGFLRARTPSTLFPSNSCQRLIPFATIKNSELKTEILIMVTTTAIWSIWKNRNARIFSDKKETERSQIKTWKRSLKNEIKMEYNIIQQKPYKERKKLINKFLIKYESKKNAVSILQNKEGKRILKINI